MTVPSNNNRFIYTGAGGVLAFAYPTKFMKADDLTVVLTDPLTGSQSPQYITSNYTVSGTQDATGAYPDGGTVTFLTAPDGYRVTIYGDPDILQEVEHEDNDPLPAASIDNPLDLLTLIAQRLNDRLARSMLLPEGDPTLDMTLPSQAARLGGYLGFAPGTGIPVILAGTGALPSILSSDYIYAETQFGVLGDGITNNTAALQQAQDFAVAAGKPLILPVGTIVGYFDYDETLKLQGAGSSLTELMLPAGANRACMRARGADALWGTNSNSGSHRVDFRDFSIHGNRDNNSSGDCLDHYGAWPILDNLFLTESAEHGLRTDSGAGGVNDPYDREGWMSRLRIKRCGKHGWQFSNPGDSHIDNVTLVDCSLLGTHLYDALHCDGTSNARWSKIHTYNHTTYNAVTLPRVRYGLFLDSTCNGHTFSESYFEGSGVANAYCGSAASFDSGCILTRPFDSADGLVIASNTVNFYGFITGAIAPQTVVGIRLGISGHTVQYCHIDCNISTCKAGLVDFTYSNGRNNVQVNGFQAESGSLTIIGTPQATDHVHITTNSGGNVFSPVHFELGTCRLVRNSNGTLRLTPIDGGYLFVNQQYIPVSNSGANSLDPTLLLTATLYYIYAYSDRSTSVNALLEASTTGYTLDSTTGFAYKTGDTKRSLVGMVYTSSANSRTITGAADNGAGLVRLTLTATLTKTVTGAANNGSGAIRLAVNNTTSLSTGTKMHVAAIVGTTEANGEWPVTVVDGTHLDLQGSTFTNAYVSGGAASTAVQGLTDGMKAHIASIVGTTEANGDWNIAIVDGLHIDLQGTTFVNAYVSGGAFTTAAFADSASLRTVASYFKRQRQSCNDNFSTDRTTTATSLTEINSEIRCEFVCWADDISYRYSGTVANSTAGKIVYSAIMDENSAILAGSASISSNAADLCNASCAGNSTLGEGRHYLTIGGYVDANTATFYQSKPTNALSVSLSI